MSISIGGINIQESVINTEFRLGVLERLLDILISRAPSGTITEKMVSNVRDQVLKDLQKKYPDAGITPNRM